MKSIIVFIFVYLFSIPTFSQTKKTIESLENEEQLCLDKGENMRGCSVKFYNQIDSLLNVVYFKLYRTLDISNQIKLKKEQKNWLLKRDETFALNKKSVHKEAVEGDYSGDEIEKISLIRQNAQFVEKRVLVLISRLK